MPYCSGGPGYTFNRAALEGFATQLFSTFQVDTVASHEDRLLSQALLSLPHAILIDTRDEFGEQRYHGSGPQQVYDGRAATPATANSRRRRPNFHSRNVAYWETLPHPSLRHHKNHSINSIPLWKPIEHNVSSIGNATTVVPVIVGPKHGFEAAATSSVAFHQIHHPVYMARMFAILYNSSICPSDTELERRRQQRR